MPPTLRRELSEDPYYQVCARSNSECAGRITWEHALYYKGSQIQARFAVVPLCVYHHLGAGMKKKVNEWIAVGRATEEDRKKYPRFPWSKYQ